MTLSSESISGRFERAATDFATRIAITAPAGQWTYGELAARANAVAAAILERRGEKPEPVALLFEHDAPLIAAILGVLRANKIYLALDGNHPPEQLTAMLESSGAKLLLADQTNLALANSLASSHQLEVFPITGQISGGVPREKFPGLTGDAGAWLMFTSGSTSAPKGVLAKPSWPGSRGGHVCGNGRDRAGRPGFPADRLRVGRLGGDAFRHVIARRDLMPFAVRAQGIERLAHWLERERINIFHSVPTVFRHLARATRDKSTFSSVRLVRLGGEPVLRGDVDLFRKVGPANSLLIQSLSSTETGIMCTLPIDSQTILPEGRVPAGRPVRGVEIFLVDEKNQPLVNGGEGKIAVRSARLRQGYWRQPELTAEKFLADAKNPGQRIFISNDLGRFLPNGMLEHLGRADQLVKIRGQRVDLSEVEAALLATDLVQEAVVTALADESGEKKLAAYFVPRAGADGSARNFRLALRAQLPEHMIPNHFVPLPKLPVTGAGKVDRRALPLPPKNETRSKVNRGNRPRDIVETRVARIWMSVLNLTAIARTDDFFELGGTSLQGVEVILQMEKIFGLALPPSTLVERSTVAELAGLLTDYVIIPSLKPLVTLREGEGGRPLFLIHSGQGDVTSYGLLARRLPGRPIYGLQSVGVQGESWPLMSVEAMAERYLSEIMEKDPTGPYLLGATCMGGMVALEMARRLVKHGREVALLAFFDVGYYIPRHKHHNWLERIYGPWRDFFRDGCRMLRWAVIRTLGLGRSPRGLSSYRRFVSSMNSRAYRRYQPGYFPAKSPCSTRWVANFPQGDQRLMMRPFAKTHKIISLPGKRATLYSTPAVDELARELQKAIAAAETSAAEKTELSSAAH